jgi:hypothetical protein
MKKEKSFEPIIRQEMWHDSSNGSGDMKLENVVLRRLKRLFKSVEYGTPPVYIVIDNAQEVEYLLKMLRTGGGDYDGL